MDSNLDISVLIATYNRCESLRETLRGMVALQYRDFSVEFVIIDNNSTDATRAVVESFSDRLSVRYLFEPELGKNRALNKAIDEVELGRIVVFTDDDVTPHPDWLNGVVDACARYPKCSVFAGKIDIAWPDAIIPSWLQDEEVLQSWMLGRFDRGNEYCEVAQIHGANFWIRRVLLEEGRRFDPSIGPCGYRFRRGSETSFMFQLMGDGFKIMYAPCAVVEHRIQRDLLCKARLRRRALDSGRGSAYIVGICRPRLFARSPLLWFLVRFGGASWAFFKCVGMRVYLLCSGDMGKVCYAYWTLGYDTELIRLGWKKRRTSCPAADSHVA